jgi:hypothetical protein
MIRSSREMKAIDNPKTFPNLFLSLAFDSNGKIILATIWSDVISKQFLTGNYFYTKEGSRKQPIGVMDE